MDAVSIAPGRLLSGPVFLSIEISDVSLRDAPDRHGAVVVPREAVAKLPEAVDLLTRREAVILDAARSSGFDVDVLKRAMAHSAEIH